MPIGQRCAERRARIPGRRLHPEPVDQSLGQDLAVRHRIQRHAAGHAEIAHAGLGHRVAHHAAQDLLGHRLQRGGHVHVESLQRLAWQAARSAEQRFHPLGDHALPGREAEIAHVEPEGAVGLQVEQVLEHGLRMDRPAIGGEPHHLVLARQHLEAQILRERAVEQPRRMRKALFLQHFDGIAAACRHRGAGPFADPVQRQDGGLPEGRGVEGRRRMALVMGGEGQRHGGELRRDAAELPSDQRAGEELSPEPAGHRRAERPEAAGRMAPPPASRACAAPRGRARSGRPARQRAPPPPVPASG